MIPAFPLVGVDEEDPNEILAKKLSEHEIQMVNEDPNYYIKSRQAMDNINLFEIKEEEFETEPNEDVVKNKGKAIKEEYFKKIKEEKVLEEITTYMAKYGKAHTPSWMINQLHNLRINKNNEFIT